MENCANFNVFLAFPWTVYSGVFQCLSTGIVRSLPPTVSHDQLATDIKRTKANSLSQSEKQTQMALLILKIIYLKLYRVVSFLQTYNYSRKMRGQFSTLKNKIITIHSLARNFFHLTPLKKFFFQDLIDRRTITNHENIQPILLKKTVYDFVQLIQPALYCS